MSTYKLVNNVNTTLAAPISNTATTITLSSSANLPTLAAGQVMALTLNDAATQSVFEIVKVTAIVGATLTVVRGQEGTTAQAWLAGDFAYAAATAAVLAALQGAGTTGGSGYVTLGNGLTLQWATVTAVAADGSSAKAVTFPQAFSTACYIVSPSIQNTYQTNAYTLSVQYDTPTTTGFNLNVAGGSGTVTCTYFAIGS